MHRLASSAVLLACLAGATVGSLDVPNRPSTPLGGLALRLENHWARSVPSPVVPTTQPVTEFELRFRGRPPRSDLGGFSTWDDQFFVVLREGAVPPRRGQTSVHLEATPLDPAALGPRPEGLQAVGNAYRLRASYVPSGRPIERFAGEVKAGFSYSLAASTALGELAVVYSRDGRTWTKLETADAPSVREVTSQIPGPGYLLLATSPAAAVTGDSPGARLRRLVLAVVAGLALVAVLVVLRRRARPPGSRQGPPAATGPDGAR